MGTATATQQVATGIINHIRYHGGTYHSWYCGVSADPRDRLINGHHATGKANAAGYWDAGSEAAARQIERYFIDMGCQGGPGGGDDGTRFVYVYRISESTQE